MLPVAGLVELIDLYAESSLAILMEPRRAAEHGDGTALRSLVHALKGSSASLGVQALQQLCEGLERQARRATLTDLAAALQ